jgi:hypothetical protein
MPNVASQQVDPGLWVALTLCAWVITVLIVAVLVGAVAMAVVRKADTKDLPEILTALVPVLVELARALTAGHWQSTSRLFKKHTDAVSADSGKDGRSEQTSHHPS